MSSNTTMALNIHATKKGSNAHVFQELTTGNLLSVGQLCDDEYDINFTKTSVILTKNGNSYLTCKTNPENGMCTLISQITTLYPVNQ